MGFFSSLFGFDKIKKAADDYSARRNDLKKICGEPLIEFQNSVIFIDKVNKCFYFDSLVDEKLRAKLDFAKYIGCDMIVNENIINEHHTSISGAIVGGLLFGTAGAIISAAAGNTTQEKKLESIRLIFRFDDFEHPYIEMNQPITEHSFIQKIWVKNINDINMKIAQVEYLVRHRND